MGTSFSSGAKTEVCRLTPQKKCCALAEVFGILLFCNSFSAEGLRIITESRDFAAMLPRLFQKALKLEFDLVPLPEAGGKLVFAMTQPEKIQTLMEAYGFNTEDTVSLHVNFSVVEDECCRASFLRGAFLAGGSVTDPGKDYHLEITTTHQSVARETFVLMREVLGFPPKVTKRGGAQVLYFKQSDQISDCLTYLGAPLAAMAIMEAKLEKDLNNQVNRRCNCDDANTSKVVEAAQEPPITKPAMNHRMKKIVSLAAEENK